MDSSQDNDNVLGMHRGLESAIQSNLVPFQEYFLQGSILDEHVDTLMARLKGLCDLNEEPSEFFEDHEISYSIHRPPDKPFRLRVRRSMAVDDCPHVVRYLGITETGDSQQPTSIRTSIDVAVSKNVIDFVEGLGFTRDYEHVASGFMYKKGRMKITVCKIHGAKESRRPSDNRRVNILDGLTKSHLVEMSVVVPASRNAIGAEMKQFADALKPLVVMCKADQLAPY